MSKIWIHHESQERFFFIGQMWGFTVGFGTTEHFVERFGMLESIIHFHVDDVGEDDKFNAILEYGMMMLGTPVGTDEFVVSKLEKHAEQLTVDADSLMGVTNLQSRYILLRYCFCPKIIYTLRTTRSDLTNDLVETFEKLKRKIFCSILHSGTLTDSKWEQCGFAVTDGGMGLGNMNYVQKCIFIH